MGDTIPSMFDGLKESERILLYCAFKKHGFNEVNVEQLAKDTYAFTPRKKYPLPKRVAAIFKMAQHFAGTNNLNLFLPIGDFGSRYGGVLPIPDLTFGTDLMVKLNPAARLLFREDDDMVAAELFNGCVDCGSVPGSLLPIIPLILVNGTDCIVSTYRSYVPMYRPKDIIANLKCLLKNEDMKPMIPWFEGFKGSVEACQDDDSKFIVTGAIDNIDIDSKIIEITELPIGTRAQDYIKLLEDGSIPHKGFVDSSDYKNHYLCLRVSLLDEDCKMDVKYLLERLKLSSIISLNEMYLLDNSGMTERYKSPLEVIRAFYIYRLHFFVRRKDLIMNETSRQIRHLDNKIDNSCSTGRKWLNVIKLSKGRLSHDLIGFFDKFIDQDLKIIEFINNDKNGNEAIDIVTTLLNNIGTSQIRSSGNDDKSPPVVNISGQSTSRDPFDLLEAAENQVKWLKILLQDLIKLRSSRSDLLQKLDTLKAANAYSLWLDDLHQLEEYLKGQNYCSLADQEGREVDTHLIRGEIY